MAMVKPLGPGQADEEDDLLLDDMDEGDIIIDVLDPDFDDLAEEGWVPSVEEDDEEIEIDHDANLAELIDEQDLNKIAMELIELFDEDDQNRKELLDTYKRGMELLGLKTEERSDPWPGACGVYHPLLAESLTRFSSEAIMEVFPAAGPASTKIIGQETPELIKRSRRVKDELNYQLTYKMKEYRLELEMIFWRQPLAGSAFRKIWWDTRLSRIRSQIFPFEDFVVAYGATALETCPRYTAVSRPTLNEIKKQIASGIYIDYEPGKIVLNKDDAEDVTDEATGVESSTLHDDRRKILEMYVDYDLPGFEHKDERGRKTGVALNYVITIDYEDQKVLSIYRNYPEENPFERNPKCFFHYKYLPGFGFYGTGLAQLLGGIVDSATSILRQLVDAGTLSNIPGGLKARGLRIKGDDTPIKPGEFRDVDVASGKIQDSLMFLPHKEPSAVLAQLLQMLIDEGRRIGSVADAKIADINSQSPVGTTLAIIERVMRVMSATQARVNVTIAEELDYIAYLLKTYGEDEYDYPVDGMFSRREDFAPPIQIIPVADPSATTISQRMIRYKAALEIAETQPHLYDMARLHREAMELLELKNPEKIVPLKDDMVPTDPVTENMNVLMMRPVKAFIYQDHEAHIQVHMNAMQDPMIMQMVGQSPNAPALQAAMMAHIQEHIAYAYRQKMEEALGSQLPAPEEELPPEIEAQIARLAAKAAPIVLGQSQAQAAQMAAEAAAQDPKLAIEQRKADLKEMEIKERAANNQRRVDADLAIAQMENEINDRRLDLQEQESTVRNTVDAMNKEEDRKQRNLHKAADIAAKERDSERKAQVARETAAQKAKDAKSKKAPAKRPRPKKSGS